MTNTQPRRDAENVEHIRIVAAAQPLQVRNGERILARSEAVLELHETGHPVRYYFPRGDVDLAAFASLEQSSFCGFKGEASDYWKLVENAVDEPVAWSYPNPLPAAAPIAGHIAFYDTVIIEPVPHTVES